MSGRFYERILKQYFTEEQNGFLESGWLIEGVA